MTQPSGSFARLAYANALFIFGTLGTLIPTALLEAWSPLHWGTTRLGAVAGLELAGLAAGSLSGLWWQRRWRWRPVASVSLLLAAAGNLLCAFVTGYGMVCASRLIVGLAGGLLTALYSAVVGNAAAPGRVVAVTIFIQLAIEALVLYSSASLFTHLGAAALFVGMAALLLMLLPALSLLATHWPRDNTTVDDSANGTQGSTSGYAVLASFVPFIVVQSGVNTFLGEFGRQAAHLDETTMLHTVGISVLLSSLGSVGAFVLNDRLGLRLPIVGGILLMTVALIGMMFGSYSATRFLVYIALLQMAWIFLNCYLYSALVEVNNLLMPAATPISTLGSVLGAYLMGYALERGGLQPSLLLCLGAMSLTALLTLPFLGQRRVRTTTPQLAARI